MSEITLKGTRVALKDDVPVAGATAPDITVVKADLTEISLYDIEGVKILIGVPSLDTGVCATETKKFNQALSEREGVTAFVISMDLPFAMKRFCETENINNIIPVSDYRYRDFINEYNTEMITGPLKMLSARAVFVIDEDNKITYSELVDDIINEPDYTAALEAVDDLLK